MVKDAAVNLELIRARLTEKFRPFAVVTSSGNKYSVPHPDFIFITRRTVIVVNKDDYPILLDPLHVVGLEDIPADGRSAKKRKRKA